MVYLIRAFLAIAGASLLAAAGRQDGPDVVEVVIGNGPNAGTYHSVSSETICAHFKSQQFSTATWRGNDIKDPKAMHAAGIKVNNPDQAGPKRGEVVIAFGSEPGKKVVADYSVKDVPVTMTIKGKGAVFSFEGAIKGTNVKVTGRCTVIEQM